jgi:two-component system NarL family sensor kinase
MDGNNLMHPWWKQLEGKNQWNLTDDRGHYVIRELAQVAREGGPAGGFLRYRWPRPPQQPDEHWTDKLGYVVYLPHWNWMLGTGIYLDDIKDIKAIKETPQRIQASSAAAVGRTMRWIAVIAMLAVLLAASVGVALNVSQQRLADAKLRKLTWEVFAAEEQERARLARYLHDEAMQDLVAVRVILETLLIELKHPLVHDKLCTMVEQGLRGLSQSIDQIRELSHGLRPRLLGEGLPALLAQTGAAFAARTGVHTVVDAPAGLQPMSAEAATALFRVTQQALDNIDRHARATRVAIRLARRDRRGASGISLTVTDDGCGFDTAAVERRSGGGIGLLNMRERIEALGGRLFILSRSSGTESGTEIEAFLPSDASREGDAHDGNNGSDDHFEAV